MDFTEVEKSDYEQFLQWESTTVLPYGDLTMRIDSNGEMVAESTDAQYLVRNDRLAMFNRRSKDGDG